MQLARDDLLAPAGMADGLGFGAAQKAPGRDGRIGHGEANVEMAQP